MHYSIYAYAHISITVYVYAHISNTVYAYTHISNTVCAYTHISITVYAYTNIFIEVYAYTHISIKLHREHSEDIWIMPGYTVTFTHCTCIILYTAGLHNNLRNRRTQQCTTRTYRDTRVNRYTGNWPVWQLSRQSRRIVERMP